MGGAGLLGVGVEVGLGGEVGPGIFEFRGPVAEGFAVLPQEAVEDFDLPRGDRVGQGGVDFGSAGPGGEGGAGGVRVAPGAVAGGGGGQDADVVPGVGDGDAHLPVAAAVEGLDLVLLAPGGEGRGGDAAGGADRGLPGVLGVGEGAVVLQELRQRLGHAGRGDEFGAALSGGGVQQAAQFLGQHRVALGVLAAGGDGAGPQVAAGLGGRAHQDGVAPVTAQGLPQQDERVAGGGGFVAVQVEPLPRRADLDVVLAVLALITGNRVAGMDEVAGHPVLAAARVGTPARRGGVQPGRDRVAQVGVAVGITVPGVTAGDVDTLHPARHRAEDRGEEFGSRPGTQVEAVGLTAVDQDAASGVEEDGGAGLLGEVGARGGQVRRVGEPAIPRRAVGDGRQGARRIRGGGCQGGGPRGHGGPPP